MTPIMTFENYSYVKILILWLFPSKAIWYKFSWLFLSWLAAVWRNYQYKWYLWIFYWFYISFSLIKHFWINRASRSQNNRKWYFLGRLNLFKINEKPYFREENHLLQLLIIPILTFKIQTKVFFLWMAPN